jgi:hypothetical protein
MRQTLAHARRIELALLAIQSGLIVPTIKSRLNWMF